MPMDNVRRILSIKMHLNIAKNCTKTHAACLLILNVNLSYCHSKITVDTSWPTRLPKTNEAWATSATGCSSGANMVFNSSLVQLQEVITKRLNALSGRNKNARHDFTASAKVLVLKPKISGLRLIASKVPLSTTKSYFRCSHSGIDAAGFIMSPTKASGEALESISSLLVNSTAFTE